MQACPTDELLQAFLCGSAALAEQDSLGRHLETCPGCLERLSNIDSTRDPLVVALRGAGSTPSGSLDPAMLLAARSGPAIDSGRRIGPYLVLEKLGEGGMGAVFRVRHEKLGKQFALKVLPPDRGRDAGRIARFQREMRAAGRVEHPLVVRATDAGEHEGIAFLVMELVEGIDLNALVERSGRLRPADACEAVRQAAIALGHAHERGLVHRDVKPSNLLLTPDGEVKLLDLGLALTPGEADHGTDGAEPQGPALTGAGLALGTRDYMAPEQRRHPHGVDARADVFGLGATLHFLLTGRPPVLPGPIPRNVSSILDRMLAREPAQRYESMKRVEHAVRSAACGADLPAAFAGRPPRKRRGWHVAAAVAAMTAAAALIVLRPSPEPREVASTPEPAVPKGIETAPPPRPKLPPPGTLGMSMDDARRLQAEWAEHLGQSVEERGAGHVPTVLIPPGSFELAPRYHVTITKPYRLGTTEVTRRQFRQFIQAKNHVPTSEAASTLNLIGAAVRPPGETGTWSEPGFPATEDSPATHLSRADAEAYVAWLSAIEGRTYRLPTEAEWRWACRAGAATRWPFGNDAKELQNYARYSFNSRNYPERVGLLRPNAWGLHDMLGNVREWSADGVAAYPEGRFEDPRVPARNGMYQLCGGDFAGRTDYLERQPGWNHATCDSSTVMGQPWHLGTRSSGLRVCRDP